MPLKFSHTFCFDVDAGRSNSFRYHHDDLYGLSAGIGRFANCAPMGYVVPGRALRFMPVNRLGNRPSSTSAPTTVPGTLAVCHPSVEKPGRDIESPFSAA